MARALSLEKHMYASVARGITRRPAVPAGARGFRYDGPLFVLLVALVVLSAVELVAIDLIVQRWPFVRLGFLVLGVWGLVWMVSLLCAHVMRPHTVGALGVRVRDGLDLDLDLPWDVVHLVGIKKRVYLPKSPRVTETDGICELAVTVTDQTNLEIVLERPTTVTLPGQAPKGGKHQVTAVRTWADEPKAFLAEVRKHI